MYSIYIDKLEGGSYIPSPYFGRCWRILAFTYDKTYHKIQYLLPYQIAQLCRKSRVVCDKPEAAILYRAQQAEHHYRVHIGIQLNRYFICASK